MMIALFLFASLLASVSANCDNQCSGHGTCGLNGVCTCFDNWGLGMSHDSGDCSERICPFEFAWVDTPDNAGGHHKYAECASKGICDRSTGQCECFAGYEGKACQRTSCPNDCSGHGQCEYIENMKYKATPFDYLHEQWKFPEISGDVTFFDGLKTFDYHYWDKTKTRGCVCDPEYADVDCSKRMCPYGNDVMDHRLNMVDAQKYQTQRIRFEAIGASEFDNTLYWHDRTFALTFKSKLNETFTTVPIAFTMTNDDDANNNNHADDATDLLAFTNAIEDALEGLPNQVIDQVKVQADFYNSRTNVIDVNVTFTGSFVEGAQNLLSVQTYTCGDGCTPKLTGLTVKPGTHNVSEWSDDNTDFNSFECGRRGKCDYDSGLCECFEGYTGIACNTITALV